MPFPHLSAKSSPEGESSPTTPACYDRQYGNHLLVRWHQSSRCGPWASFATHDFSDPISSGRHAHCLCSARCGGSEKRPYLFARAALAYGFGQHDSISVIQEQRCNASLRKQMCFSGGCAAGPRTNRRQRMGRALNDNFHPVMVNMACPECASSWRCHMRLSPRPLNASGTRNMSFCK